MSDAPAAAALDQDDPVEALFHRAVDLPLTERAAFLDGACHGDSSLRAEVEALLAYDQRTSARGRLLDAPLLQRGANDGHESRPGFGPPASPGEIGTLGPFRILRALGSGGMGAVYAALDTRLNRRLAIKVMLPNYAADSQAKERFLREAHAAAQINHDNVVCVYEADERDGIPYIAMPLLEGRTLDERLRIEGAPPLADVLRIGVEVAQGLAAAHAVGLVHRDLKPANLWLEATSGRVKVLDFGLAKPLDKRVGVTQTGAIIGTPAYMSPEQARGETVDARSDLFNLGAVLYRLCSGRVPFDGPSTMAILMALGMQDPPPLRTLNPEVPQPLADLIQALLAKDPRARPESAADVVTRLRAIEEGETSSTTTPPLIPSSSTTLPPIKATVARRTDRFTQRWAIATIAALLAAVSGGVLVFIHKGSGSPQTKSIGPPSSVAVKTMGNPVAPVAAIPSGSDPIVVIAATADRDAALWVLSFHGVIQISDDPREINTAAELPEAPFALTGVDLHNNKAVTDAGLAHLRALPRLTFLQLEATSVTDAGLVHLSECRALRTLWLNNNAGITGDGFSNFERLQNLEELFLGGTSVNDVGTPSLGKLKGLKRLFLQAVGITDAGLAHLGGLPNLEVLDLYSSSVTADGVGHLKTCSSLTTLNLGATHVSDAGLANLSRIPLLTKLLLNSTAITDAGLDHLKDCRSLTVLHLGGTVITDAGLTRLGTMTGLTMLDLQETRITDEGLGHLEGLKSLDHLDVLKTVVTAEGIKSFHTAVPRCRIDHNRGTIKPNE